ncbi:hypothetical protein CesoFtcFv8_001774 [Champsocephalus esox]|uniref:Uncharacterized protein n=1 Tax=Champsocephalus esox TaxID=159716 RepID=A0AAN8CWL4_9TELE|nr:hypothetical protein CesoFtcFv8_001774 [Champsocephalus esox]
MLLLIPVPVSTSDEAPPLEYISCPPHPVCHCGDTQALLRHGPRRHDLWSQAPAPPGSLEEEEQPVTLSLLTSYNVHSQEKESTCRQRGFKHRI